jgi:hypothetical protein
MCFSCDANGGYCVCGTSRDTQGSIEPCEVKRGFDSCQRCGHRAGHPEERPAVTDADVYEYE